ncbi:MAG: peptidase, partial [Nitrososphaeraceae archaeon]
MYKFDVQIFGIDNPRNIFIPQEAPKFETFLSVGDVYNFKDLQYNGQTFNTTLISYYDQILDFNFDSERGLFSWSMPFYYNLTRLRDNPIFVHEEIKLPKTLFG